MNGPPTDDRSTTERPDAAASAVGNEEQSLVLHAVIELVRCQREILETVHRLEVSLDELHDRIEASSDGPDVGAEDVHDAPPRRPRSDVLQSTEEQLLRAIQRTVNQQAAEDDAGGEPRIGTMPELVITPRR